MRKQFIIVGIDPGTTVGIACLDLYGAFIAAYSSKELSINGIIEKIMSYGYPAIIATDVTSLPQAVEKISASLDAKLYVPSTTITIREKNEITKMHPVNNAHERDALSAAIKAYQHYSSKFENIDARLREMGKEKFSENVKALVLKEYSVSKAIEVLCQEELNVNIYDTKEKVKEVSQPPPKMEEIFLKTRIKTQKAYINELESSLKLSNERINKLEQNIREWNEHAIIQMKRSKEVKNIRSRIKNLQEKLLNLKNENASLFIANEELKNLRVMQLREEVLVCKTLEQFSKSAISGLEYKYGIKPGDVIYLKDSSGGGAATAKILCEHNILAIITETEMSHTSREKISACGIAIFNIDEIPVKLQEDYVIVEKDAFENAYNNWIEKQKRHQKKKKSAWLEKLIKEYRYERKKKEDIHDLP